MGPGSYDVDKASSLTKPKVPNVNMGSSPSRPERVGQIATSQSTSNQVLNQQRGSFTNVTQRTDRPRMRQNGNSQSNSTLTTTSHRFTGGKNVVSKESKQNSKTMMTTTTKRIESSGFSRAQPVLSSRNAESQKNLSTIKETTTVKQVADPR